MLLAQENQGWLEAMTSKLDLLPGADDAIAWPSGHDRSLGMSSVHVF